MAARAWAAAFLLLLTGCGSGDSCADLVFDGREYDEWRPVALSPFAQELGDGTYPACRDEDLGGYGATDVYLLEGTDPSRAVIGLRQDSRVAVVFVRRGAEPPGLP